MSTCSTCGAENTAAASFCVRCGAALATCERCGAGLPQGVTFCPACGHRVAEGLPAGKERKLTVLFADVAGSTGLGERSDPDEGGRWIDGPVRDAEQAVRDRRKVSESLEGKDGEDLPRPRDRSDVADAVRQPPALQLADEPVARVRCEDERRVLRILGHAEPSSPTSAVGRPVGAQPDGGSAAGSGSVSSRSPRRFAHRAPSRRRDRVPHLGGRAADGADPKTGRA
ncbi:MAG: zinc ribbon domain-containing protein [Actinobacteria bacterium]|nr:MAG: zinc ribbon domain-containing protein [Actinomycetota bacterium]